MKRIAIIGNAFGGSTTSLIEAFLKQEYVVDFYHLILGRRNTSSFETFDLPIRVAWYSVKQVKSFDYDGLRRFIVYGKRGRFSYVSGIFIEPVRERAEKDSKSHNLDFFE